MRPASSRKPYLRRSSRMLLRVGTKRLLSTLTARPPPSSLSYYEAGKVRAVPRTRWQRESLSPPGRPAGGATCRSFPWGRRSRSRTDPELREQLGHLAAHRFLVEAELVG